MARTPTTSAPSTPPATSVTGSCTVKVDATPPTTTATGLGADNLSDWGTAARPVSLAADDGLGAGVATIRYAVDGGAEKAYTGPFVVSGGVGQHPVTYWSVDKLGHVEAVRTGWVNIADFYAQLTGWPRPGLPVAQHDRRHHDHGRDRRPVRLLSTGRRRRADDTDLRKLPGQRRRPPHGHVLGAPGSLESTHQTGYVNIDVVKPVTAVATPAPTRWVNHEVKLSYSASDNAAGVETTYSAVNGTKPVPGRSSSCRPRPRTSATASSPSATGRWTGPATPRPRSP